MPSQITSYATATRALLYATAPTLLKLSYDLADPLAVRLELVTIGRSWHVARDRLWRGLTPIDETLIDDHAECAAHVHISQMPNNTRTLLILRGQPCGRYPMTVDTGALRRFLEASFRICPRGHEQRLLELELAAQLELLTTSQGGS